MDEGGKRLTGGRVVLVGSGGFRWVVGVGGDVDEVSGRGGWRMRMVDIRFGSL